MPSLRSLVAKCDRMSSSPSPSPIRVVLADDHEMVREALARILQESGRIDIVAQAHDAPAVIDAVRSTEPDLVVLDYSLPTKDAPQTIERLLRISSELKILVLTVHENIHYAVRVLEAGGHGYLIKSAAVDELVEAIDTVRAGRIYLSAQVSDEVLAHLRQPKRQRVGLEALSPREFDLLKLLGAGESLQASAERMKISTSTASTYRSRIMEKLNLGSTAELIRFAVENKLGS
ncbi:MAG: DNA-binding response regulator [Planctomycetota bacterium]|nr:MAG: DNA-binding response regulator [Planctomycetota bacterium]REJ96101.1 MAG: DNA-binding response regulator [Planctomycetota bacterium]